MLSSTLRFGATLTLAVATMSGCSKEPLGDPKDAAEIESLRGIVAALEKQSEVDHKRITALVAENDAFVRDGAKDGAAIANIRASLADAMRERDAAIAAQQAETRRQFAEMIDRFESSTAVLERREKLKPLLTRSESDRIEYLQDRIIGGHFKELTSEEIGFIVGSAGAPFLYSLLVDAIHGSEARSGDDANSWDSCQKIAASLELPASDVIYLRLLQRTDRDRIRAMVSGAESGREMSDAEKSALRRIGVPDRITDRILEYFASH